MSRQAGDGPSVQGAAGAPACTPLRVKVLARDADLRDLEPTWERVFEASETRTPFLSFEWALSWWESFGEGQRLRLLVLEDGEGTAGMAPLVLARRRAGPFAYRVLECLGTGPLRFLGMGLADRSDFLLARRREDCVRAVLGWLREHRVEWDVLDLRFLPAESTTARVLLAESREAGLRARVEPSAESPFLVLEGSYKDYLARRSRNHRKGLKRRLGRLEEMGPVEVDPDVLRTAGPGALAHAVQVSAASWKEQEGSALLLHRDVRSFFERLLPRLVRRDRVYLGLVRVGGRPVAHELGFRLEGKLWSYDSAFDRAYAEGSPGVVLTERILEQGHAEGLGEYDFLRGGERYKHGWTDRSRREVQLVVSSPRLRSRLARALAYQAKWALKRSPRLLRAQGRAAGILNRWLRERAGEGRDDA